MISVSSQNFRILVSQKQTMLMKRQHIIVLLFLLLLAQTASAQTGSKPDTSKTRSIRFEMAQARLKYKNDNYKGALKMYQDMLESNPHHETLNFRTGECYFKLKDYKNAVPHLEKCIDVKDENYDNIDYYLARSYQKTQEFNKAREYYKKHLNNLPKEEAETDPANNYLVQVNNAIRLMGDEVDVDISNMGEVINSAYVDAAPSITADKSVLIFTSRRPKSDKALKDPVTGGYYDNVYIAHKQEDGSWSEAKPIPGDINTKGAYEASTSISPDGKTIFIYRNIAGITKSGDIFYSEQSDEGKWSEPKSLEVNSPKGFFNKIAYGFDVFFHGEKEINSSYFETSACITADNNELYFISEREKKGFGQGDIWVTHRINEGWSVPRNLGKNINTPDDEVSVYIHPDGKTIFYASNGKHSMGGYDILMSHKKDGKWSDPVNLGYPVNTPWDESHFTLAADGKTAYISSNREGTIGKMDIYTIDMKKYFNTLKPGQNKQRLTIVKGTVIDEDKNPISTEIDITDAVNGKQVTTIQSDKNGDYFITLPAGHEYEFSIKVKGMEPIAKTIKISEADKAEDVKSWHFILSKK